MTKYSVNRRAFIFHASAAAGLVVLPKYLKAQNGRVLRIDSGSTPLTHLHDPIDPSTLRDLATQVVDTGRRLGATFVDIRIADNRSFGLTTGSGATFGITINRGLTYGIRVIVDGAWAHVRGYDPHIDAAVTATQGAVALARRNALVIGRAADEQMIAAPTATGEWHTPFHIAPLKVPIFDQMALLRSWADAMRSLWKVGGRVGSTWKDETRVLASSEGTLITQFLSRSEPFVSLSVDRYLDGGSSTGLQLHVPEVHGYSGGYEALTDPAIYDYIRMRGEMASHYASLPFRSMDVGRYPVVLDGALFGAIIYEQLGQSLEMDRVLGYEADASGTSLFTPWESWLGKDVISPRLTISVQRTPSSLTGAKWDDDGVEARSGTVFKDGRLVGYQTTRRTAGALASWYEQHHQPVTSWGCALAADAGDPVLARCGDLAVAPSSTTASLDDLIQGISRGIAIIAQPGINVQTDQQFSSGSLSTNPGVLFLGIEKGRITHRIDNMGVQWRTLPLLKSVSAVGDDSTVRTCVGSTYKGQPWIRVPYVSSAPAALVNEVNVFSIGGSIT
jgi:TldD protein